VICDKKHRPVYLIIIINIKYHPQRTVHVSYILFMWIIFVFLRHWDIRRSSVFIHKIKFVEVCSLRKTASTRCGMWEAAQVFKSIYRVFTIYITHRHRSKFKSIVLSHSPLSVRSVVIAPNRFRPPRFPPNFNLTHLPNSHA